MYDARVAVDRQGLVDPVQVGVVTGTVDRLLDRAERAQGQRLRSGGQQLTSSRRRGESAGVDHARRSGPGLTGSARLTVRSDNRELHRAVIRMLRGDGDLVA